jgi:hypothetical protein
MGALDRATIPIEPDDDRDTWTYRLQSFLADRISGDHDEACADAEPFVKD